MSAAVGAFLVGLALSGDVADQARKVPTPLRDLFAATFFLAIGFAVGPAALSPVLPAAAVLAVVSIATKLMAGWYAASREGVGRRGRVRAGTALIAHGEFSIVIMGLVGAQNGTLDPLVVAYVLILAVAVRSSPGWLTADPTMRLHDVPRLVGNAKVSSRSSPPAHGTARADACGAGSSLWWHG